MYVGMAQTMPVHSVVKNENWTKIEARYQGEEGSLLGCKATVVDYVIV